MRIGIDARAANWDGAGRYIENLVDGLAAIDKENEYLVFCGGSAVKRFGSIAGNVSAQKVPESYYSFREQLLLPLYLRGKVDVMHFPNYNKPVFYRGLAVTTVHDLIDFYFEGERRKGWLNRRGHVAVLRSALKNSRLVIVDSETVAREIIGNFEVDKAKIRVVPLGADHLGNVEPADYRRSRRYVFYVGNARVHKSLPVLLRAFEMLGTRFGHDLDLVLAGRRFGGKEGLLELAKILGIERKLKFVDGPSDGSLKSLYQNAEVLVQPSLKEGFGLTPLEAMAEGTPAVVAGNKVFSEVLGEAAMFFEPGSPIDLARAVNLLLRDDRIKGELSERGKAKAGEYSWRKTAEATLNVYREAAA